MTVRPTGSDDLYGLLGLPRGAPVDAVKRAFRALAVRCHPDKCPGDAEAEERFKAINRAHEVLGDPESKAAYDGVSVLAPSAFGPAPAAASGFAAAFERRRQAQRGPPPQPAPPEPPRGAQPPPPPPAGARPPGGYAGRTRSASAPAKSPLRGRRGADGRSGATWAEAAAAGPPPPQPQSQRPPSAEAAPGPGTAGNVPPEEGAGRAAAPPAAPPPPHFSTGAEGDAVDVLLRKAPYAPPLAATIPDSVLAQLRSRGGRGELEGGRGQLRRVKVVSCGSAGCGKSALIKRLCEGRFPTQVVPTIGVDFGVWRAPYGGGVQVNFFDLSGDHAFHEVRSEFYSGATAAMMVYDSGSRDSFAELEGWLREMRLNGLPRGVPVTVVAAKGDVACPRGSAERAVPAAVGEAWALRRGFAHCSACARTGDGVEAAFAALVCDAVKWAQVPRARHGPFCGEPGSYPMAP